MSELIFLGRRMFRTINSCCVKLKEPGSLFCRCFQSPSLIAALTLPTSHLRASFRRPFGRCKGLGEEKTVYVKPVPEKKSVRGFQRRTFEGMSPLRTDVNSLIVAAAGSLHGQQYLDPEVN